MHAFWQALEWMANTILFIWVRQGQGGQDVLHCCAQQQLNGQHTMSCTLMNQGCLMASHTCHPAHMTWVLKEAKGMIARQ
jgi:hypothetical protein